MSGWNTNGVSSATLPLTGLERGSFDTQALNGLNPITEAVSTGQLATYLGMTPAWVAGRFYGSPFGVTPVALLTVTATLYAYPIFVPSVVSIATFNIGVTTGQTGGAAHIGIYKDNGAGYPGALIYDTGAIAGLTSTVVVTNTPTTPPVLQPGWYWIASIFTASGTFPSVTAITANYASATNAQLGSDTAAHLLTVSGEAVTGISVAGTYGALPTTFTAAATLTINASTPMFALGV